MSRIVAIAAASFLVGVVSCGQGSRDPVGGGGGSCALELVYRSHTYYPYKTAQPVEPGRPLNGVRYPPCNDFGGGQIDSSGHVTDELAPERTPQPAPAHTIAGVDPAVAFVAPVYRRTLFFSGGYGTEMPPEVEHLLKH